MCPLLAILLLLLLSGCAGQALPLATATPVQTSTPAFTPFLSQTFTPPATTTPFPSPTFTPLPTATPLPTPGLHEYATRVTVPTGGTGTTEVTVRYLLFFPKAYDQDAERKWPLILFLHGSGEAGSDLNLVTKAGLPALLLEQPDFPFVVVAPQLPAQTIYASSGEPTDPNTYIAAWGWGPWIDALDNLLDVVETSYAIDRQRVYLTGLSLGGFGAWEYALRCPKRFAAVAPIAGGYRFGLSEAPANICALKDTPIWAFHGDADTAVPYENSEILVKALQACGGDKVKFTLYPGASHNESFTRAYADPELYEWMLEYP
jgi:predicted peptidase